MKTIWDRIHLWLELHAPLVLESLKPGTTDERLAEAESVFEVALPADVKASYRIHDGQYHDGYHTVPGFLFGVEWFDLGRAVEEWGAWKDLFDRGVFANEPGDTAGAIRQAWWHPAWIPLTGDGAGNHYCLDTSPTQEGTVGQIITLWHDDALRELVAPCFGEWLTTFAGELEAGLWMYAVEYGGLVRVEDLAAGEV
jgi:cell wall assembly regulator SMI1